ncbi:MAG TPA: SCO family protein [Solirubrobacterales bacterium]|jgi:protein SCO1/2|nr:SCO family protein [Solirubrobacterales bacterium]
MRVRLSLPLAAIAIVAVVGVATVLIATHHSAEALPGNVHSRSVSNFAGQELSPRKPAPSFGALRNYLGEKVSLAAYRGKAVFVTFLYTHCPDVCPLITAELHNTLARLGPRRSRQLRIVAVSVDPHRDTRQAVSEFLQAHGMTGRMKYLIGGAHELAPVWEAWNVGSEPDSVNPEFVAHSALIYGISAKGLLTTIYPSNFNPSQIVHDLPKLLND